MTIRIKNTPNNKLACQENNANFEEQGNYLVVYPTQWHQMWLNSGQMSVSSYKKNVLGI